MKFVHILLSTDRFPNPTYMYLINMDSLASFVFLVWTSSLFDAFPAHIRPIRLLHVYATITLTLINLSLSGDLFFIHVSHVLFYALMTEVSLDADIM